MKRGTAAKVILGKDTLMDVPAGIVHGTDVILGGKAGLLNDFGGLVLSNNLMLGKKVSRGTITTVTVRGQSPLVLPDAISGSLQAVKAFGGTEQRNLPLGYTQFGRIHFDGNCYFDTGVVINSLAATVKLIAAFDSQTSSSPCLMWGYMGSNSNLPRWGVGLYTDKWLTSANATSPYGTADTDKHTFTTELYDNGGTPYWRSFIDGVALGSGSVSSSSTITGNTLKVYIGARNNNGTAGNYIKGNFTYLEIIQDGACLAKIYPCKRDSDNVLGLYNTVTNEFLTNLGAGTLTADIFASPTPDAPMDIVCNNGVLKARHQSGLPIGYTLLDYIESTGTQYIDTRVVQDVLNFWVDMDVSFANTNERYLFGVSSSSPLYFGRTQGGRFEMNQKYTSLYSGQNKRVNLQWGKDPNSNKMKLSVVVDGQTESLVSTASGFIRNNNFVFFGNNTGDSIGYILNGKIYFAKIYKEDILVFDGIPAKRNSDNVLGMYDLANDQFYTNDGTGDFVAGTTVSDPVEVYTAGPIETIAIKDDQSATVSSAVAEMLLKISDYADQQEIIGGTVTRKVGIKVLDGTENWVFSTTWLNYMYSLEVSDLYAEASSVPTNRKSPYCTHFGRSENWLGGSARANMVQAYQPTTGNAILGLGYGTPSTANLAAFKQYLADQYNAGTPVIAVYPLATQTTETVTGQTLQVTDGDNTLEITQASLAGLELEATYKSLVQLTIQEVEDANLNNNVEVTIS